MQKEIIEKIDLLTEMAGSNNSYETLIREDHSLCDEIDDLKEKICKAKEKANEQKYINANERIIDENIRVGLENRLSCDQSKLSHLMKEIENVTNREEEIHHAITLNHQEDHDLKAFLESILLRVKTVGDNKASFEYYTKLTDNTSENIKANQDEMTELNEEYESILNCLKEMGQKREELESKIAKEMSSLSDINEVLNNPLSYIDQDRKIEEEQKIEVLAKQQEKLEKRHLEIITDPLYISHEAKELLVSNDMTGSLAKVKELVTIVESTPYMTTRNEDLEDLLQTAQNKRDEIASSIDHKQYDGNDESLLKERVDYLAEEKINIMNKIKSIQENINQIDTLEVPKLVEYLEHTKDYRNTLKKDIQDYQKLLKDHQNESKKEITLQTALERKKSELDNVETILFAYQQDLEVKVNESREFEEVSILECQKKIKQIEEEKQVIDKKIMLHSRSKDILAIEKDKETLHKLSLDVDHIIFRKKYQKLPSEIYDEIELAMNQSEEEPEKGLVEQSKDNVNLNDYWISEDKEETPSESLIDVPSIINQVEEVEVTPIPTILKEEPEDVVAFPPRKTPVNKSNRIKVINVEPINKEEKDPPKVEPLKEDDYMINDLKDNDFISFNDLLERDEYNGNKN